MEVLHMPDSAHSEVGIIFFLSSYNTYNYLKGNVKVFIFIEGIRNFFCFSQKHLKQIDFEEDSFWMSLSTPAGPASRLAVRSSA